MEYAASTPPSSPPRPPSRATGGPCTTHHQGAWGGRCTTPPLTRGAWGRYTTPQLAQGGAWGPFTTLPPLPVLTWPSRGAGGAISRPVVPVEEHLPSDTSWRPVAAVPTAMSTSAGEVLESPTLASGTTPAQASSTPATLPPHTQPFLEQRLPPSPVSSSCQSTQSCQSTPQST